MWSKSTILSFLAYLTRASISHCLQVLLQDPSDNITAQKHQHIWKHQILRRFHPITTPNFCRERFSRNRGSYFWKRSEQIPSFSLVRVYHTYLFTKKKASLKDAQTCFCRYTEVHNSSIRFTQVYMHVVHRLSVSYFCQSQYMKWFNLRHGFQHDIVYVLCSVYSLHNSHIRPCMTLLTSITLEFSTRHQISTQPTKFHPWIRYQSWNQPWSEHISKIFEKNRKTESDHNKNLDCRFVIISHNLEIMVLLRAILLTKTVVDAVVVTHALKISYA